MKRIINILQSIVLSAFALIACQREEIVETPQFTAVDEAGNVVSSLDQSGQYTLELMSNAYSLAENKSTETLKASPITISSNCTWKIVPAEEGQDWVYPYPDHGEKEGRFIFISERNFDQKSDRTAYFNVIVNDGIGDRMLDGMIVVKQASSADFLKVSKASLDILKEGAKNQKISVLSNLEWSYSLTPDPDYATEDLSWIEDKTVHPADQSIDTLVFTFADNTNGSIRGAILDIKAKGKPEFDKSIKVVQYGADVEIEGFPVMWEVDCNPNTYASVFPSTGVMPPVSGAGQIRFDNTCGKAADTNNKTKLDIESDCPRVTGVWPGDYCEFKAFSPVSAGSLIKLTFTTRVSKTGHKYWRLEYRDGSEWKIAGTPMTDSAVIGPDGNPVVYTHVMAADGKTNIAVSSVVKYANTTDEVDFRFYCAANSQASGDGPLKAPNGGTWRLAMDGADTGTPLNPSISCVSAGSEVLTPANVVVTGVSDDILTFEGTPEEPATIGVTSDMDFTVTANVPWLTVENGTGLADETKEVSIICAPSEQSTLRRGEIEIKSGITKRIIKVIQSAAGGELEPFVSIVGGNSGQVSFEEGMFNISVQSNVEYEVFSDAGWVTVTEVPQTRALVDIKQYEVRYQANADPAERTAYIRVFNAEENLESIYTLVQDAFVSGVYFQDDFTWLAPMAKAEGASDSVGTDNPGGTAPNVWKMASSADFFNKFNEIGYSYLYGTVGGSSYLAGPAPEPNSSVGKDGSMYLQDAYLKFGQGKYNMALKLPPLTSMTATDNVLIEFDWCWHVTGGFKPDLMTLVVDASAGTFPVSEASTSEAINSAQSKVDGDSHLEWQHASVVLTNATSETVLTIRPSSPDPNKENPARGQNRWYIDNIKVSHYDGVIPSPDPEPEPEPEPEPSKYLNVSWLFSAAAMNDETSGYAKTFGTLAGVVDGTAGDGGQYVNANGSGNGKITYVQVDKTSFSTEAKRITGKTGDPYVSGMWIGDYWLFEATDGTTYPSGTKVSIDFLTRVSKTGIKYWRLEYLDGTSWKPVMAVTKENIGNQDIEYNLVMTTDGATNVVVSGVVTLTSPMKDIKFRMVCAGGTLANGNAIPEEPNAGTSRITTADATGPVIKVITE